MTDTAQQTDTKAPDLADYLKKEFGSEDAAYAFLTDPKKFDKEKFDALTSHYRSQLPSDLLKQPGYGPAPATRLHSRSPVGKSALYDDANQTLVACGAIAGGNPPTGSGHLINWGSLTRTGAGVYTITLGNNGINVDDSIDTLVCRTATGSVTVAHTSDTVKTFTCLLAGVASDAVNFCFSFSRMPFTR